MIKLAVVGTRGFPGVQGGIESHCQNLYVNLAVKGCDITVFTRRPYINSDLLTYKGISLIPVNCFRNKFLETLIHTFKCVIMARRLNPDILHIHAIGPSLFAPLARGLGMKVVVTSHGPEYERKKWSLPAKIFLRFCELIGAKFANQIITIAGNIAEDIKRKYGRDAMVIPNGVNIPKLAETEESLLRFHLQKNRYILSVGRFVPEKGFDDLIDAFNQGSFTKWKLVIVGDADHEDKYSRELKVKASKNSDIVLTGFLTGQSLHEIYTHAGLFVLPSYYEGLPIALLEAMSYGLSCIASDIPANKNIELRENRFFRTGDINLLSSRLSHFINNRWEDGEREKQINLIADQYSWEKIAGMTLKVYEKTIQ